jgi:hypothetical protein
MKNISSSRSGGSNVYVMRLWQEQSSPEGSSTGWRFSIENPSTGQRRGFSALAELAAYLENLIAQDGYYDKSFYNNIESLVTE